MPSVSDEQAKTMAAHVADPGSRNKCHPPEGTKGRVIVVGDVSPYDVKGLGFHSVQQVADSGSEDPPTAIGGHHETIVDEADPRRETNLLMLT